MNNVLLIGAGNMGGALLQGWLGTGHSDRVCYHVIDPDPDSMSRFPKARCYAAAEDLPYGLEPDFVILAVKPEKVVSSLVSVTDHLTPETCVVSVAAGITIDRIRCSIGPKTPIVRIMPNIGATAGYSVSAGYAPPEVPSGVVERLSQMFSDIGQMNWLDKEDDLHVVTAVSGSGPAYYFAFCEAFRDAAVRQGLPAAIAQDLAVGTAIAAGRLLEKMPAPEELRHRVTSPKGTTAAGLSALFGNNAIGTLAEAAVEKAKARSITLGEA